jgi:uncharacterized protein (DUF2235 family)
MAKRIIVLSDGTGNSAATVWRTNVGRTFEALNLTGSDQIAFYDDGVGTSSFKPAAILGGAFGFGLKRNVIDLYKFLCRNYQRANPAIPGDKDDEIFAFGFSRGAFTIRVLMGLVLDQGLITAADQAELDRLAIEAYRNYRARHFKTWTGIERPFRWLRDVFLRRKQTELIEGRREVDSIRFLGLWDTVAAYGLPIDEMTRGVSRYLWPLELPNRELSSKIRRACHALSLDDQRTTFHPVLWDEAKIQTPPPWPRLTRDETITQIWFAGVHANVGGGYPDDSLAYIPMWWIWKEAKDCGLVFKETPDADPDALLNASSKKDKDGRLYDSRSGVGGYYRYGPRDVHELCNSISNDPLDFVRIKQPKIHDTVFERISIGAHPYAPVGLPPSYDIVAYDPANQTHVIQNSGLPETGADANIRYQAQEDRAWSTVWRGRCFYFLSLFATIYLLTYPLASSSLATDEVSTPLRFVSDMLRLAANVLPGLAARWIDAYARDPFSFLASVAVIFAYLCMSSGLRMRITGQMQGLLAKSLVTPGLLAGLGEPSPNWRPGGILEWLSLIFFVVLAVFSILINPSLDHHEEVSGWFGGVDAFTSKFSMWLGLPALLGVLVLFTPASLVATVRRSRPYKVALKNVRLIIAPALFALMFVYLIVGFGSHYVFDIRDSFGGYCPARPANRANFVSSPDVCVEGKLENCTVYDATKVQASPANAANSNMCGTRTCTGIIQLADTQSICAPLNMLLTRGERYYVKVEPYLPDKQPWTVLGGPSDPGGRRIGELWNDRSDYCWSKLPAWGQNICNGIVGTVRTLGGILVYPLKRSFDRQLGEFVIRYGATGNEENFLDADMAAGPKRFLEERFNSTINAPAYAYINKPVFGIFTRATTNWNSGIARVTLIHVPKK